ncbi:MAG TPA: hypothetical protein VGB91_01285 [Rhizomicrobium sp.]
MTKYDRLGAYLRGHDRDLVPMTFAEIERVTGVKLPASQKHQAWWSNSTSNNVMTQVWLDAGYRTERVDVAGRRLVFRRVENRPSGLREEPNMFKPAPPDSRQRADRHPASGALKGMVTIEPGYDIASSDPEEVAEWEAAADRTADLADAGMKKNP